MTKAEQQLYLEQNLRNLQIPNDSLWWPPAVGWWVVAALSALFLGSLLYRFLHRRAIANQKHLAISQNTHLQNCFDQWLKDHDTAKYVQAVNSLLKQTAVEIAGRSTVARLNGDGWVKWMEHETDSGFSSDTRSLLSQSGYKKNPPSPDLQLHSEIENWHQLYTKSASVKNKTRNNTTTSLTIRSDSAFHA